MEERRTRKEKRQVLALKEVDGFRIRPGFYDVNGATVMPDGVNFTVYSNGATSIVLNLYHHDEQKPFARIPFPQDYRIGKVYSMFVFGLNIENMEYAYQVDGPWDPANGLLFDRTKILLDPYAKAVAGQRIWGDKTGPEDVYHARVVSSDFDWKHVPFPKTPMSDTIIYEMHVRSFTKHPSSGVKAPGTFAGIMEKIGYLKSLGVTAVELMPVFEFDETLNRRVVDGRELLEFWGYNTVSFFAPNTSYASKAEYNHEGDELKELIRMLKMNDMEVILDVVFNHTAEGNENGPVISFKGFDNNIYYMLTPDGKYYNFSGTGNTMNCNHPMVQEMIVQCLRHWVTEFHVDGFRFDLASILGRNQDGSPMENPPLLQRLAYDPILGDVKLIAEAWDAGGMYQVGSFPAWKRWAEWNGKYRDELRSYLKGDLWCAPDAVRRIIGSPDLYDSGYAGYDSSVNFLTCHDGFTLYDLYSYNHKHNELNGWGGTDGADDNRSWNCGTEGRTEDEFINNLRFRMMRNAITVLMCSRGTPMILAGDEFANSQYGNNNAYCQDNEISWLDWSLLEQNKDYFEFYRNVIAFRKKHPAIRRNLKPAVCGYPFMSVHGADGNMLHITGEARFIAVRFAGYRSRTGQDDIVYLAINAHWEKAEISLPAVKGSGIWQLIIDTGAEDGMYFRRSGRPVTGRYMMQPRSVCVFTALYIAENLHRS
ncbi:MAG: glycogen debranching protein GlgX [Lachnospiraceae bacterium]|nr:glycogen debranching protein GlgX [Lachnospiraceae bacterium]